MGSLLYRIEFVRERGETKKDDVVVTITRMRSNDDDDDIKNYGRIGKRVICGDWKWMPR